MSHDWWRSSAIYQIYPRSFCDSDGDGIGDLRGVTSKLDYVASLGVDGIWLSPFFVSPMADFGYDVADYRNVDPLFGTLADFDDLLARAHSLGLKVLIDLVLAHTSDRHPWFMHSRGSRDGLWSDWYIWADPCPDGTQPNNWLSVFGGQAWHWEPRRRQYYLHHFLPSQPKLNLRNLAVLDALLAVAKFWLDRGVDGFRLDAVDFLSHDERLRDNPPAPGAHKPLKPYHMQQHLYDLGGAEVHSTIERVRAVTDRYASAVMIAEVGSETTDTTSITRAGRYIGDGQQGVHAAYSLAQMKSRGDAAAIRAAISEVEHSLPAGGLVWTFSNHDVARVASRWGDGSPAAARLFMALLLCLRGGCFIYQGEELGLPDADIPFERLQDPYGRNYWPDFKGRDGARTPMPWSAGARNAGFSRATWTWLPIPDDHRRLAVDLQESDPGSVLHAWRRLLHWRKRHPALQNGTLRLRETRDPVIAFERAGSQERLFCVFNLAREAASFTLPNEEFAPIDGIDGFGWAQDGPHIRLAGYGIYIAEMNGHST